MGDATIKLKVVTPVGSAVDEIANAVTAQSELGEFCILPDHRPILTSLETGRLVVDQTDGEKAIYVLERGFLEGGPDHVSVITQRCVEASELQRAQVQAEIAELEQQLDKLEGDDELGRQEVEAGLRWARACLASAPKT